MATKRSDWQMPEPPVPGAIPAFYNDGNEIWLHWVEDAEECLPVEPTQDIPWPFNEDYAEHSDFEALGFINADP